MTPAETPKEMAYGIGLLGQGDFIAYSANYKVFFKQGI
jgi:hypothetical protein